MEPPGIPGRFNLLGFTTVGAGTAAVFFKNNNGGSLALIAVGALFLVMAITGRGVRSVNVGNSGFVLAETVGRAVAAKASGDEEGADEILHTLIEMPVALKTVLPDIPPNLQPLNNFDLVQGDAALRALTFEQAVQQAMYAVAAGKGMVLPELSQRQRRFDFLVSIDDVTVAVEARAGTNVRADAFSEHMRSLLAGSEVPLAGLFVVINAPPGGEEVPRLVARLRGIDKPFQISAWRPEDGVGPLREEFNRFMTSVNSSRT